MPTVYQALCQTEDTANGSCLHVAHSLGEMKNTSKKTQYILVNCVQCYKGNQ